MYGYTGYMNDDYLAGGASGSALMWGVIVVGLALIGVGLWMTGIFNKKSSKPKSSSQKKTFGWVSVGVGGAMLLGGMLL